MTSNIVNFPTRQRDVGGERLPAPGDIVVDCVNRVVGLWAAWPVVAASGGNVTAVQLPGGNRAGCMKEAGSFDLYAASDYEQSEFGALRFKTFRSREAAARAFEAVML